MTIPTAHADVVDDPVSHISISGVHGRDELEDRLAHARPVTTTSRRGRLSTLLLGTVLGAAVVLLARRKGRALKRPLTSP